MSSYRPRHHLTPPQGRLNDPNGVYVDGDSLHVYYQHDPGFPHADKRTGWGHAVTTMTGPDALTWRHRPNALYPDAPYDRDGCYSGSAVVQPNGQVRLYYTGNVKDGDERQATQNLVHVEDPGGPIGGVHRRAAANPLIDGPATGYTSHFRDPQITWDVNHPGTWRMLLGAQREDGTGAVVLYRSQDLDTWEFAGELDFTTDDAEAGSSPNILPGGFMWECPNLTTMVDSATGERLDVLIICPQGLQPQTTDGGTHYRNGDCCGYLVGRLRGTTFDVVRGFSELDHGHEFYAPQIAAGDTEEQTSLLIGWMGLPAQDDQPSLHEEGWVHCLTVPRLLSLRNHRLHQQLVLPAPERTGAQQGVSVLRRHLADDAAQIDLDGAVTVDWTPAAPDGPGLLSVTRDGDRRVVSCPAGELVVFRDRTAVEITAGDGAVALALRMYP